MVAGQVSRLRGAGLQGGAVDPGQFLGVGGAGPEPERPLVLALGLGEPVQALGRGTGVDGGRQGPIDVLGLVPVVGHMGDPRTRAGGQVGVGGEGPGVAGVEAGALLEEQLGIGDLAQQGVAEPIGAAVGVEHEELVLDGLPQGIVEGLAGDARRRLHQPAGDVDPADGGCPQHLLGRGCEHAETGGEDVVQRLGQPLLVAVERRRE